MTPTRSLLPLLSLLAVAALVPAAAGAQGRRTAPTVSIEAGGLYAGYRGGDFRSLNDGPGFDVQGNVGVSMFSLGGGYHRTTHDVAGASADATVSGFYVEPRVALPLAYGNFTPYLLGRVMRLERRIGSGDAEQEATGTAFGGGLGILVWVAPGVQLNSSAAYYATRLTGDAAARTTGTGLTLRLGLSLGGTGWGRDEYAP